MKITYDASADAVYIAVVEDIGAGGVAKTVPVDPVGVGGMINLDMDDRGRLVGIEILDASRLLSPDLLVDGE